MAVVTGVLHCVSDAGGHVIPLENAGGTAVALYERALTALPDVRVLQVALASLRLFDSLRTVAHDLGYDLV